MVDLNKVALFTRIVETGSFSGAARSLGMPRATVSRQIAQLEENLGVRLLHRTTRRLELTAAGETYFAEASQALRQLDRANRQIRAVQETPSGVVRIASIVEFGNRLLTDWLSEFLMTFAQVKIELILTDDPVDFVGQRIDIALLAGRPESATLISRKLLSAQKILLASPDYLRRRGEPDSAKDLSDHDFVITGHLVERSSIRLRGPEGIVPIPIQGRLAVNSAQAALRAAIEGLGIVLLAKALATQHLTDGSLRRVLSQYEAETDSLYALYPSKRNLSAAVRALLDFISSKIETLKY